MVKTIGADRATAKWVARAGVAGPDYEQGVKTPKRAWASSAAGAASTYKQAVSAADIGDRFSRGVNAAGDAKWQAMAVEKGVSRFSDGVAKSEQYYRSGIGTVIGQIERVSLPKRGPRGSTGNYDRARKLGEALHAARLAKTVGGGK